MTKNKCFRESQLLGVFLLLTSILVIFSSADLSSGQPPNGQPSSGPEIEILNISFSDGEPMEGDDIVISTYIKNNFPAPIENITVSFLLNNELLKNVSDVTLGANETKSIEYEWTTEKGTQNIGIRLYKDGIPLQIPMTTKNIYVEQEPLGDIETLVFAILIIFIFILILVILPSIWTAVQPEIKPYEYLRRNHKR